MVKAFAALVLLILVGLLQAQASCPVDNSFLALLRASGMPSVVLPTVQAGSTFPYCTEVWASSGTCCEPTALQAMYDQMITTSLKAGFDKFIKGVALVRNSITKVQTLLQNQDILSSNHTIAMTNNPTLVEGHTVEEAIMALNYSTMFEQELQNFITEGETCFNAMKNATGALVCYGCSGITPPAFIVTNGSVAITPASCDILLNSCLRPWHFMHEVTFMMQTLAIINQLMNTAAPLPVAFPTPNYGGVPMPTLMLSYNNCKTVNDTLCAAGDRANICMANFNLLNAPDRWNNRTFDETYFSGLTRRLRQLRILQGTPMTGDIVVDATGIDLTTVVTPPTSTATVDFSELETSTPNTTNTTSGTGESSAGTYSSSGNALKVLWSIMAIVALFVVN